ncbi:Nlrc3 [Symbiodinium sp. CCMP2592]|nr:Nlrc3 [Symbiodinium sp. CCMP2592]
MRARAKRRRRRSAVQAEEYDLADKRQLAAFLQDADIQLGGRQGTWRISPDAFRIIVRNLKGDRFTVDMLQAENMCAQLSLWQHVAEQLGQDVLQEVLPDRRKLSVGCASAISERWLLVDASLRRPGAAELRGLGTMPPPPGSSSRAGRGRGVDVSERFHAAPRQCLCQPKRYDLAQKKGLADFLIDADIRLVRTPVRADFILKLRREGQRLPRRQEAESAYVDSRTALVTHEEVQAWAKAPEGAPDSAEIVSLSHCWESREHCDPYGYQVAKLAKALTGKEWVFIDYVSLYQFQRLLRMQNVSFGRAMQHMHVLYCHEKSSTLRIESLTPEADIAEAEPKEECVRMYHHPSGLVKPVPVTQLQKNRTAYRHRGWCAAEREWSSTRTATNLSREVDALEGEKGGIAPMLPEAFRENVARQLKFTHLDDVETVCRLQAEVYKEKAEMCRSLRLVDLGADALGIALSSLENYPNLESLGTQQHCPGRDMFDGPAGAAALVQSLQMLHELTELWVDLTHNNKLSPGPRRAAAERSLHVRRCPQSEEEKMQLRASFDALPVGEKTINL